MQSVIMISVVAPWTLLSMVEILFSMEKLGHCLHERIGANPLGPFPKKFFVFANHKLAE
jgi:hypothetical protein